MMTLERPRESPQDQGPMLQNFLLQLTDPEKTSCKRKDHSTVSTTNQAKWHQNWAN